MASYEKETDRFVIVTEGGEEIGLIQYTEYIEHDIMGKGKSVVKGHSRLVTIAGEAVNHLGDDRYQIVETGVIGTRQYDQGD